MFQDDEDDFYPTANSNLASVFGNSFQDNYNSSLTYVAPKQPKPLIAKNEDKPNVTAKESKSTVIYCKPITLYKIVENSNNLFGKYALVLIGNEQRAVYEILIYQDPKDISIRIKLSFNFFVTLQKPTNIILSDNNKQFWTIRFDKVEHLNEFVKELEERKFKVVKLESTNNDTNAQTSNKQEQSADSSDAKTKADILSRIVKMGQKTLPTLKNDTDTESIVSEEAFEDVLPTNDKNQNVQEIASVQSTDNHYIPPVQTAVSLNNQTLSKPVSHTYYANNELPSNNMHIFFAEHRTHNTEIRMNINHLSAKLDNLLMDFQKLKTTEQDVLKSKVEQLEAKLLSYETLTKINSKNDDVKQVQMCVEKLENKIETLISTNTDLKVEVEKLERIQQDNFDKRNDDSTNLNLKETIKDFMNDMYENICSNFNSDTYTSEEIKKELAKCIKSHTLNLIAKLSKSE